MELWSRSKWMSFNCVFPWSRSTGSNIYQRFLSEAFICFLLWVFFPSWRWIEVQSFKHLRAEGGEWGARENECFVLSLPEFCVWFTEVVFLVCHCLSGGRKLKALVRIQNVKLFPYLKFNRVLLMTSVKPGSHVADLDGSVTLWWPEKGEVSWDKSNWDS